MPLPMTPWPSPFNPDPNPNQIKNNVVHDIRGMSLPMTP